MAVRSQCVCYDRSVTPEAFKQELQKRGFNFNTSSQVWVGPFNIQVTGILNGETNPRGPERNVGNMRARAALIGDVDEQLRARRGLDRVPLVEPVNRFSPFLSPYVHIPEPGNSPATPAYPPHQQNLPPDGRRLD